MLTAGFSLITYFLFNPVFLLGYAVAVLMPVPFLNAFVVSLWSRFGGAIMASIRGLAGKATQSAETAVADAVASAISGAVAPPAPVAPPVAPTAPALAATSLQRR